MMVPFKEGIGIDEFAEVKSKYCCMNGLKMYFNEKPEMLKSMLKGVQLKSLNLMLQKTFTLQLVDS